MGTNETFEEYYDESYEASLPHELTEDYDIVECLSCVEGCDTLLVKNKQTGEKMVAKCYTGDSVLFDRMETEAMPYFAGKYKNDKYRCILREYIEGVSLDEYVKTNRMTEDIILDIAIELVKAMKKLHDSNPVIIHRDIKPQNIIVKEDGSIALIDFGISRVYKKDGTVDTIFCGTEDFAPPEQYGFMQTDMRSDIYAFGVVLAWMITGKAKPIKAPLTKLERVAAKCCEFSPNKRYKNDVALLKDLNRSTRQHAAVFRKRIKRICAAVLLMAVALFGGGVACWISMKNKEVAFKEPLIEEAVRAELERPSGIITKEDLQDVTEIYIHGDTITTSVDAYYSSTDEWFFSGRVRGDLTSLEDLKNMPNLQTICIGGERIKDISPLKELDRLEKVELWYNDIVEISALDGKQYLSQIGLANNQITDISALESCPAIQSLILRDAGSFDGKPIEGVDGLALLDISADTDAWKYLSGKTVSMLKLGGPDLTELSCVRDMAYVEELYIYWSGVTDISALEGREDITYLNMSGCMIDDLSPVFTMPNLRTVVVSVKSKEDMETLLEVYDGEPTFAVEYAE